jgi:hypothetical protein
VLEKKFKDAENTLQFHVERINDLNVFASVANKGAPIKLDGQINSAKDIEKR